MTLIIHALRPLDVTLLQMRYTVRLLVFHQKIVFQEKVMVITVTSS
jgi:hypothetical protein